MSTTVHPPEIAPATKIWDINTDWSLYSQCCIWDSARGCVHIWECIRPRMFLAFRLSPLPAHPLTPRHLHANHKTTKLNLLALPWSSVMTLTRGVTYFCVMCTA
ncbi:hypothetical protein V8B97DRAFT_994995 [Scleroderma yunnanense]